MIICLKWYVIVIFITILWMYQYIRKYIMIWS